MNWAELLTRTKNTTTCMKIKPWNPSVTCLTLTIAVNKKFTFRFHFYDRRIVHCERLVNEMDVKSTIIPTRGEKCTFRVPLTQDEHSNIDCLTMACSVKHANSRRRTT